MVEGQPFRERGFGIIQDDDGGEVFCHISAFHSIGKGLSETGVYNLAYRRRLLFELAVDPIRDKVVARDVWLVREIMAPDGTIIELPPGRRAQKKQAEAERGAKDLPEAQSELRRTRSDPR
jgi:'Cold-shock' DNA-binding domain